MSTRDAAASRQLGNADGPRVVDVLASMPERQRFIRGMVSWVGGRQVALPYERQGRHAGTTAYPLRKMAAFAVERGAVVVLHRGAVLLVHHTGKDAAKGARGHSSLRAAIDTEIDDNFGSVQVGDVLTTSGVDGVYPPGLKVASPVRMSQSQVPAPAASR